VYHSEFSTETGPIECIYNYKRGFIKLPNVTRGWRVPQWLSADGRDWETSSCPVMKLEASEIEGQKMQPQSKPKGLEAPWTISGEFIFKAEEAGV
jgi:hypothetical protein